MLQEIKYFKVAVKWKTSLKNPIRIVDEKTRIFVILLLMVAKFQITEHGGKWFQRSSSWESPAAV